MGWAATVAGTLIAVMFVYHWFNKDASAASSQQEGEGSAQETVPSTTATRMGRYGGVGGEPGMERPTVETQPPSKFVSESGVQPSLNEKEKEKEKVKKKNNQDEIVLRLSAPPPQFTTMPPPPPPPPSMAPGPTAMGPPPVPKGPPRLKPPTFGPAPTTTTAAGAPRPAGGGALRPPPSSASSLRIPPTKVLANASMAPSLSSSSLSSSMLPPPKKASKQVVLEPGHSPLDWAALTTNPNNKLRGKDAPEQLIRVTPSRLKIQNGRKGRDAWTVFQGKVYNVTPYVPFHPGGKGELLRGAGKDSAQLFMEVHPWVNWDGMLGECCVGVLVGEDDAAATERVENTLDEMD